MSFAESDLEEALIAWLREMKWDYAPGPTLSPGGEACERESYSDVLLRGRVRSAIESLNPKLPADAVSDAFRRSTLLPGTTILAKNQAFHRMLTDGVPVEYIGEGGRIVGDRARLFDFEEVDNNDFLVVNQLTIVDGQNERRPDVVLFVNGFPLVVIELKRLGDENATVEGAFNQLETYKEQIPDLFAWNELLTVSDGVQARTGTTTSEWERFAPWKTIGGEREHTGFDQLHVLTRGSLDRGRLLDLVHSYIVFEVDGPEVLKKVAAYHQYWAVRKAIDCTLEAATPDGDHRVGVVWHTQGSGKSLSMVIYAGQLIRHPAMANPTLVVLTDRNDLDSQLFDAFCLASGLIPAPIQADDADDLKALLSVPAGGVVFTTVQKFKVEKGGTYPCLSNRRNIIVITDEAHRSQYDFIDGFARNIRDALPNASFIGFTGTPIESGDRITRSVFGDYIDIYDIAQAVEDGATVPIYYESRLIEVDLDPAERKLVDDAADEATEGEEDSTRRKVQSKWARVEALVGAQRRVAQVAEDLVTHFEERLVAADGKALVVCMSRPIAARLYSEIIAIRPEWHSDNDDSGVIKVVITGSASDPAELRPHIRNRKRNKAIQRRLKDPADPLKLVIVRDMWLTGFDAPVLHTMYIDKPMRGHGLMQAIARVNRVFKGKPGGLVVDYLGLGPALKAAIGNYTKSKGHGEVAVDLDVAVAAFLEKIEVVRGLLHPFDYSGAFADDPISKYRSRVGGLEVILGREDGEERFIAAMGDLLRAFKLAGATPEALGHRDEVVYFMDLRGSLAKVSEKGKLHSDEIDFAMSQIVHRAVITDGVVDIFAAAGMERPDISIVSDEFLAEVQDMPQRNLAASALEKLLRNEIRIRRKKNVVEAKRFSELLDAAMAKYHNRAIEAAQVILELVAMAKDFREMANRGEEMNLTDDELAFYDALATNGSAVDLMGDETLRAIARELAAMLQNSVTVDWKVRESVRADLRLKVKRLLRKHKYPPDEQEAATQLVLQQTEVLADHWTAA